MLTRDEKELLDALKEHMDDEQKEALSEMSEADIKEFLKEARKEVAKEMSRQGSSPDGCMGRLRAIRDCPWKEVIFDDGEYNMGNPFAACIIKLFLKICSTKLGCGFLIVVIIVVSIIVATQE